MNNDAEDTIMLSQQQPTDPIKHVVLLLMENHSFDQMLGCFQQVYPELEGIDPNAPPRFNIDPNGQAILQLPTLENQVPHDPKHEHPNVMRQLESSNAGFVRDFANTYPNSTAEDRQYVMGYYPLDHLPGLHALARDFTICDHWFSSLPGPTWPNRFFALSGTSSGRVTMPNGPLHPDLANIAFEQDQKTIFDCLDEVNQTWRIYFYDFPASLILTHQRHLKNLAHYTPIDAFFEDARKPEAEFPAFTFIEPKYFGIDQNDDHPPHNVMKAQKLIADVYNAIRSNPDLWESTLLVVAYDEHGGFYDHVTPPKAIPPDAYQEEYAFDQLGVRVPALLVSPWVGKGVEKTVFDHTSLLKYLCDKWGMSGLGNRTAAANSIACSLRFDGPPRTGTIPFIRVPNTALISKNPELERWDVNAHQSALHMFADYLHAQRDRASGEAIGLITKEAGRWVRWKARLGHLLANTGHALMRDLETHGKARIERTQQVVDDILGWKSKD